MLSVNSLLKSLRECSKTQRVKEMSASVIDLPSAHLDMDNFKNARVGLRVFGSVYVFDSPCSPSRDQDCPNRMNENSSGQEWLSSFTFATIIIRIERAQAGSSMVIYGAERLAVSG